MTGTVLSLLSLLILIWSPLGTVDTGIGHAQECRRHLSGGNGLFQVRLAGLHGSLGRTAPCTTAAACSSGSGGAKFPGKTATAKPRRRRPALPRSAKKVKVEARNMRNAFGKDARLFVQRDALPERG